MTAKSDVLVKMGLVFFISLLSFSIGTFVGKKYSDNQHKLAALEPSSVSNERQVASSSTDHSESGMTDDEIAKLAEEFAEDTEMTEASKTEKAVVAHTESEKSEQAPAKTLAQDEPQAPAKKLVAGQKAVPAESVVAAAKRETRLPTSLPKDVAQYSVGKFTIQVASFANETEAKGRAEQLKNMGFSAFYVPAEVKGKTWYRVSVGLFATEKEAKDYRTEFMEKAKTNNVIIQKIVN